MRFRSKLRAPPLAASAVLIALGCVYASTPLYAKKHSLPKQPRQVQPPKVHLIRCAEAPVPQVGWPCGPDPGMLRLNPRPHLQAEPSDDLPTFTPERWRASADPGQIRQVGISGGLTRVSAGSIVLCRDGG